MQAILNLTLILGLVVVPLLVAMVIEDTPAGDKFQTFLEKIGM